MTYPEYLTPDEVAKLFRVDVRTVNRWANAGKIPSVRTPGGHRRYFRPDLERLIEESAS